MVRGPNSGDHHDGQAFRHPAPDPLERRPARRRHTPADERQGIARRFQEDPDTRLLIANPAAAGTGFTLTAASYTVYESLSWRYDHYAQSQDRNHRIGQTEPVTYVRLLAADTIEEAVVVALARKSALARGLLGDEDAGESVARLTQEEMCNLLG